MQIGERILKQRTKLGLSRKALSEKTEKIVSETAIKQYEAGLRQPRIEKVEKLAPALDCTVTYLLFGTESDDPHMTAKDVGTTDYLTAEDMEARREAPLRAALNKHFDYLNMTGKEVAVERVSELAKIPDYTEE